MVEIRKLAYHSPEAFSLTDVVGNNYTNTVHDAPCERITNSEILIMSAKMSISRILEEDNFFLPAHI